MPDSERFEVSPDLASALAEFEPYLLADDVERSDLLEASDSDALRKLAETVEPLLEELNATLDRTLEASSLTEEEQELESNLHSLAQAAIEARMKLEE